MSTYIILVIIFDRIFASRRFAPRSLRLAIVSCLALLLLTPDRAAAGGTVCPAISTGFDVGDASTATCTLEGSSGPSNGFGVANGLLSFYVAFNHYVAGTGPLTNTPTCSGAGCVLPPSAGIAPCNTAVGSCSVAYSYVDNNSQTVSLSFTVDQNSTTIPSFIVTGGGFRSLPPTVSAIAPTSGTTAGGTAVTITGTNLTGATAVTIGGSAATGVSVVNATTITATTPTHVAGTADVVVTTPGGTGTGTGLYTYVTPAPTVSDPNWLRLVGIALRCFGISGRNLPYPDPDAKRSR